MTCSPLPRAVAACLLLAALVFANRTSAQSPKRAAVLEFELASGVKNIDRIYLSDRARTALHDAAPSLFVMTRESTEALLQANGKTMADCTGECEVEVGRKLGADYIVSGRITQFGSRTSVTMRLFATADGQLLSSAEATGKSVDELFEALGGALVKVLAPLSAPINSGGEQMAKDKTLASGAAAISDGGIEPKSGLEFVRLPGGVLVGGNFAGSRVAPFSLGRTATTTAAYGKCVAAGGCTEPNTGNACNWKAGRENHPINCVDWDQAGAFCRWIGGRLPTAEQREWAASGGEGRGYPWGAQAPGNQLCWDGDGSDLGKSNRKTTCPVGAYPAGRSKQGVLDLAGNVWEWLDTDYNEGKEVRGGTWYSDAPELFGASEFSTESPAYRDDRNGFRCAQ